MIRALLLLLLSAVLALAAQETPGLVLMGYTGIGPDGQPQGVSVALNRVRFAALIADATSMPASDPNGPVLAIGPGIWRAVWRDGRWSMTGTLPVAAPSATWGDLRLDMPGTVTSVQMQSLGGAVVPPTPVWRMDGMILRLSLPPRSQALLVITAEREARIGDPTALAFPPGGSLALASTDGLVVSLAGNIPAGPLALPISAKPLSVVVDHPAAAVDSGSLGFNQSISLRHLGDRITWHAEIAIDSQRQPPAIVELVLPPRLDVLAVHGEGLAGWRQRDGVLELRWASAGHERSRRAILDGVIVGDGPAMPALGLASAARGGGSLAVADAGPVRWTVPESVPGLRRVQPEAGERFRVAWDGAAPVELALSYSTASAQLAADGCGLLVVGPGRWRAEVAFTLVGAGLADHIRVTVPAPWRVIAADGAVWLPDTTGSGILRAATALASGAQLVLRCEAPEGALDVPGIAVAVSSDGVTTGRMRWLVADHGALRARLGGSPSDGDALLAELARVGIRPRTNERLGGAIELRAGVAATLSVSAAERRQRLDASHYLIAGPGAVRWACHVDVRPEQGGLDRVRIRLPIGARLADRRGEGVAEWVEADGWLTARYAAPLDRPASLDLTFTAAWGEASGRERVEIGALTCEPALDHETVALAEDEEAGQLVHRLDGLDERPASAVLLPAGVAPSLLASRTWAATGTSWHLTLERERLDQALGVDAVATLVDVHSAIDPDGRLVSRATWYVINRSRSALELVLPAGCSLWEVRISGQIVRARQGADAGRVNVPMTPLRPGEAATRIQVCWAQGATEQLHPRLPVFTDLRVMRALWRFSAPPGTHLRHVDGWEPVPAGDATGARVEVLADELKRLRSSSEESPAVRARLADQLLLIDQELTDHVALLENLGQDPARWTGDIAVRQTDMRQQQEYLQRNSSFNDLANDNRQAVREKLGKLSTVAKTQRDRRGGLLLDGQAVRWAVAAVPSDCGPDFAARRNASVLTDAGGKGRVAATFAVGGDSQAASATAALTGIDLLPVQDGEELTLRADSLAAPVILQLDPETRGSAWGIWMLLGAAALALGVALSGRFIAQSRTATAQ